MNVVAAVVVRTFDGFADGRLESYEVPAVDDLLQFIRIQFVSLD